MLKSKSLLTFLGIAFLALGVQAQNLKMPAEIQAAFKKGTRELSGKPWSL